jgi:murein DD-endopeptidase MepM/ murein hydrolase activator NlpD
LAEVGAPVVSPIDGVVDLRPAYKDPQKSKYKIVSILSGNTRYRFFYVSPDDDHSKPLVKPGDHIGKVQDIAASDRDGTMRNHIHFELWKDGKLVDPTQQVEEWQRD